MTRPALLVALLLASPALAQDQFDVDARMNACMAGVDADAVATRAEAYAAAHDYQPRVDALCAAGDPDAAAEFARGVEQAFYASDPDGAKMRACLIEVFGEAPETTADEICQQ